MNNITSADVFFPDIIPVAVLKCVGIFLTVVGNGVVILAVITNKRLRRVPDNLFICSLAVTDFLIGALVMAPGTILTEFEYSCHQDEIEFHWNPSLHIRVVLMLTSIWNLFIISYDRYHFIVYSLQYSTWMTGYKVPLFCVAGWFISIVLHLLYRVPGHYISPDQHPEIMIYNLFIVVIARATPIVGMLVAYANIVCFTNKTLRQTNEFTDRGLFKGLCNTKQARVLSLLVFTFYILWCPHIIYLLVWVYTKRKMCTFLETSAWLTYCNSLVNPFIYTFFNASFRRCILSILTCRSLRQKILRREVTTSGLVQSRTRSMIDIMERPKLNVIRVDQKDEFIDYEIELQSLQISDKLDDGSEV